MARKQVQAIGLGLGERLFVAKDHVLTVVIELAKSDEAFAFANQAVCAGHGELLRIGEDAGLSFGSEHALRAPVFEIASGAAVDVLSLLTVKQFGKPQNDADQIVRAAPVIGLLHRWRNLVVGLRYDIVHPHH